MLLGIELGKIDEVSTGDLYSLIHRCQINRFRGLWGAEIQIKCHAVFHGLLTHYLIELMLSGMLEKCFFLICVVDLQIVP